MDAKQRRPSWLIGVDLVFCDKDFLFTREREEEEVSPNSKCLSNDMKEPQLSEVVGINKWLICIMS